MWGGRKTFLSGNSSAWSLPPVTLEQSPAHCGLTFYQDKIERTSATGWTPWEAKQLQPGRVEAAEAASGAAGGVGVKCGGVESLPEGFDALGRFVQLQVTRGLAALAVTKWGKKLFGGL